MPQDPSIGTILANFQSALEQNGDTLTDFIKRTYIKKWTGDALFHAVSVRTTWVNAMHNFLTRKGLLNLERVTLSPVTDPLAHDVEYTPSISYKGIPYVTTHSMIYSKFLACFNPKIKGVFIDSPNIRLELESPSGTQRGKYLIDFSQMDIEIRREKQIALEEYLKKPDSVGKILKRDLDTALDFFEDMIIEASQAVAENNADDLKALKVRLDVPIKPFPRFKNDEAVKQHGARRYEMELGKNLNCHFFWVTGMMRENYDLIYPYLREDGSRRSIGDFTSDEIYNYDLCIQSRQDDGKYGDAYEVLSGGLREWLYEPIVARLMDNKILKVMPEFAGGKLINTEDLDGYGPFLIAAKQKSPSGKSLFPATYGGGIGIERSLFALLKGKVIKKVEDVTFFGKNPDSHPLYVF